MRTSGAIIVAASLVAVPGVDAAGKATPPTEVHGVKLDIDLYRLRRRFGHSQGDCQGQTKRSAGRGERRSCRQ